jgi:YjbE family integral membrane protein
MGHFSSEFFLGVFSIILIDVLLAGDNAVVIAMAVKSLPPKQRRIGIAAGAAGAALIRIVLTFFAAQLLLLRYVKFIGGAFIVWIAVNLLVEAAAEEKGRTPARSLWHATWLILVADVTMSTDNILAVAASSKGNLALLIFGLGLSITFVVFASSLLAQMMDRYPVIVYLGAAILGRVGGNLMITDPWIEGMLHPSQPMRIGVEVSFTLGVLAAGWLLANRSPSL